MALSRILVTGVGLGKDLGACNVCNYDLSWLFANLGNLIWIDRILLSSSFRETIENQTDQLAARGTQHLVQQLDAQGLIETYDIKDIIHETLAERISRKVDEDIESLVENRIVSKSEDGRFIMLDSHEYCWPALWSYYASVILSQVKNAQCYFDDSTREFIIRKLELYEHNIIPKRNSRIFHRVLVAHLPDPVEYPYYIFHPEAKCTECSKLSVCESRMMNDLDKSVEKTVQYRNYDELVEFRKVIETLVTECSARQSEEDEINEIEAGLKKKVARLQKIMQRQFPKWKRYLNILSIISIPIALAGFFIAKNPIGFGSAAVAGASEMAKKWMSIFESKNNWISFMKLPGGKNGL